MTKALTSTLIGALLTVTMWATPLRAEETPAQNYIVLVGIDNYADNQIKSRQHAETDAKALYDLFTHKEYLGADKDHVRLLLGSADAKRGSQPATKENILKALNWAVTNAGPSDLVIFAYFGQGGPLGDRTCLFASDSTFKDRAQNAVASADIEHELEKLKSQRFCAFVDVNLKGFETKENVAEPNPMDFYREFIGNLEDSEDALPPEGRIVFLATNGMRQSLDLEKNGVFAYALLQALKGAADKEGYEPDGVVTTDELVEYLNTEMPKLVRRFAQNKEEMEQLHHVLNARASHFVLTNNPAAMPKVQERLAKLAKLATERKISSEAAEEGEALLRRMPKLQAQQDLRKAYQRLADGALSVTDFLKNRDAILATMQLKRSEAVAYATRVMQAIDLVRDNYVKEVNNGEMVAWAIEGLYRRLDEKKLLAEMRDQLKKAKGMNNAALLTLLADSRQKLGNREDLANNKDVDYSIQTMLSHLDPYTNYIDAEMLARFKQDTQGRFSGIGIQIRKDATTDALLVVTPIKGSPAYHAGIKAGDLITKVIRPVDSQGKPLSPPEELYTKDLSLSDAVKKILGQPGTKVKLIIQREGEKEPREFEITRGTVEVESVLGHQRKDNDEWDYVIDPENRIAYVRLTSFQRNSFRDLRRVVYELSKEPGGIKGFVFDLRFNPGGLLDSAVRISDLFIDDGLIVSIRPRVGRELPYSGESEGSFLDFPMVCLINGGSASGSEIVAACLQDHNRAVIMGERSYGKGSVQNIADFESTGGQIKLTTATYWRPSGKNINKSSTKGSEDEDWGVLPEKPYLLKLTPKERDELAEHLRDAEVIQRRDIAPKEPKSAFQDKQLDMALEYLRGLIKKTASRADAKQAG